VSVGGKPVEDARDFQMRILRARPGTVLPITVRRDGEPLTLRPTLSRRRRPFRIF